jgi:hypothetical protein
MRDLSPDINQTSANESKGSIFDSYKFWGQGKLHRKSLSLDLEKSLIEIKNEDSIVDKELNTNEDSKKHTPKQETKQSDPITLTLSETISGNYIITRGWDDNNMMLFKIRRKIL